MHAPKEKTPIERVIVWVGSVPSLILHTLFFIAAFLLSIFGYLSWALMLLILTTLVSLEAIYLAIFIQMTVNRQSIELAEVGEDIDEIQEDIDEIQEDVEEMHEHDEAEDRDSKTRYQRVDELTRDLHRVLSELEQLKKDV